MIQRTLEAVHARLFANAELTAIVGKNIHYARAPVSSNYPQVIYFDVAARTEPVMDHDKVTVQFSAWSGDKFQALTLQRIIYTMWLRYSGTVGAVKINWTELSDMAALPQDDAQLFGYQVRFEIRTKGANIGA